MHKRLSAPEPGADRPPAGDAGLDRWLWSRMKRLPEAPRILDVGCGFGGTLQCWSGLHRGAGVGLGLSPFQIGRAEEFARGRGLGERLEFRCQSFADPIAGGPFHCIVSIESLFHAADLQRTAGHLARNLAPGGYLLMLEDMLATDAAGDCEAARSLSARWHTPHLPTARSFYESFAAAGLQPVEEVDLSDQVPVTGRGRGGLRAAGMKLLRAVLPWETGRRVLDAFLGGLDLEDLYREGRMQYRVMLWKAAEAG